MMYFPGCGCLCPQPPKLPGYKIRKHLGQGACGPVWLADDETHPQHKVAIKCLPAPASASPPPLWAVEAAEREAVALSAVGWGHVNLIRPLELLLTDKWLALVLRYCRGGTLEQYCRGRQVSEDFACYLLHQLVDVVEHLHRHNVAYRDLKLENVLLDRPVGLFGRQAPPRLVLADFGCAKRFKKGQAPLAATFLGTPGFMSPQVLATMGNMAGAVPDVAAAAAAAESAGTASGNRPSTPASAFAAAAAAAGADGEALAAAGKPGDMSTAAEPASAQHSHSASMHSVSVITTARYFDAFKADSWALGALLHYMLLGTLPYDYESFAPLLPPQEALLTLLQLEHSHTWREAARPDGGAWQLQGHRKISKEAQDLLDQLLHPDEQQRLDIEAIRAHPWLQRRLPPAYAAALQDLRDQQAVVDAAARSTNAKECRRLVSVAVHKLFDLSRNPRALHNLQTQQQMQQPQAQQEESQGSKQPVLCPAGSLSVPLLCLKRGLAPGAASGGGGTLTSSSSGQLSAMAITRSWSLEAALAVEVVEAQADSSIAAGTAVNGTAGTAAGASLQQQQSEQAVTGGSHVDVAAAVAAATAAMVGGAAPGKASGAGAAAGSSGGSSDVVRQQLLEVLGRLDRTAVAAGQRPAVAPAHVARLEGAGPVARFHTHTG